MTRQHGVHRCSQCGAASPRWVGRCPSCGGWNTLAEERAAVRTPPSTGATLIGLAGTGDERPVPTGVPEVDRVLGGGFVPGSVTLLGGEPGAGKSTLMLQLLGRMANDGRRCLLVAAEESISQVRLRAERLETVGSDFWIAPATDMADVRAHITEVGPAFVVIDSIQAVADPDVTGSPGSVAQVRACAHHLVRLAKEGGITTVLVGHVTKDGSLAGPRALEHLVDTVLSFGGDRHHALRTLRAVKHRFGSTAELGLFEMTEAGLEAVADPGHLFLADRRTGAPGSVVAPVVDGRRPLLVELQALVAPAGGGPVRRSAQGVDGGRLSLLLAVLDRRAGVRTSGADVYALAAGGARVTDPGADLPLALAVGSAALGVPVAADVVACGEIGLGGELRQVPQLGRRLAEAARLGFRRAIVPASAPAPPEGITTMGAASLSEALARAGLVVARPTVRRPATPGGLTLCR